MGTNYYFVPKKNRIEKLNRMLTQTDKLFFFIGYSSMHIGKSSLGWTFTFQATEHYKSYKELLTFYENNKRLIEIHDEYGEKIEIEEFKELVERKRKEPNNHCLYMRKEYPGEDHGDYLDEEGNSFSKSDFS